MSKALKCDICGSFFNGLSCINIVNKNTTPNDILLYLRAENGNTKTVFDYDMCPDCYNAIMKTIVDRKKLRISSEGDAEV